MQRRRFIILGGAAAAWPFAARAQQADGVRRIGALIATTATDLDGQNRLAALRQGMRELGWSDGQNAQIDVRWADSDDLTRRYATEIVRLKPDVIVANGTPASIVLRLQTQTIPIVFVAVTDPVGQGLVQSLPRPGGNLTGFTNFEFEMGGKWLQLLKEIMPQLTRNSCHRFIPSADRTLCWVVPWSHSVSRTTTLHRSAGELD
jgi:ABC transporter substrate binding protein